MSSPSASQSTAVAEPAAPRLRRRRQGRAIAGVAGGLADHVGVPVLYVRVAFAVLSALGGAGAMAYGLLWIFAAQASTDDPAPEVSARERQQAFGLIALGAGLTIGAGTLSGTVNGWFAGSIGVTLVGAALVWREADQSQRRRVKGALLGGGGRSALVRVLSGGALVVTGIVMVLISSMGLDQVQFTLLAVVAALVGVAMLTVPWWLRMVRDLGDERRARIRTEERAEIAAHLHDSVLQTLALIQKQADAPREVLRLARGQERQLRSWLYGPAGYGGVGGAAGGSLAEALARASGEVEDTFAIKVQHVVVGDCELDAKLTAVVMAAREAMVNAAKHAGVAEVSVYAEVEPETVTVFVRDRGKGFDPEEVPEDRHGLADSIRGRMERNGGEIKLRTAPGDGTEVQLHMPRAKVAA
ncbi:PspC domain-containing protein [Actinokineospora auranticolor]|uniref:Signal transduction histidine kinase n=1 Tax=Actinokineospora auranticolor TaxID=155976 RepID=A0A2S6GWQ5_9PSEU|nr:ATP-binding protein [Actinokineospora auranticolor]PPK69628.1 signal transduction histidine kinase [Actinokineospora auranticolor]